MDPYDNYDNDYSYSSGGYNYSDMDYGAQPYYQFNPYTSSCGSEWEYAPSYLDQQLNTSPPSESKTPTEQQLLRLAEMIQEFQASELVAICDLEYKVKQLDEEVERRLQQSMIEVTPEVYDEDGMNLVPIESSIPSSVVPSVISVILTRLDHIESVVDIEPKFSYLVLKSLLVMICLYSGKVSSLFCAMNSSNQSWWWGLKPIFLTFHFQGVLNSYDMCKEKQRFALLWYNYP